MRLLVISADQFENSPLTRPVEALGELLNLAPAEGHR
jgi:hypothetical protein